MSSRAIDLSLKPAAYREAGLEIELYTYDPQKVQFDEMATSVKFAITHPAGHTKVELTADEARVLANQLLQVADQADEHKSLIESFEEFSERQQDPEYGPRCEIFVHPWVHYVKPGEAPAEMKKHHGRCIVIEHAEA